MEITIGRDGKTRQLNVVRNGKSTLVGQAGSVPLDVSRQHVQLKQMPDGKWQLRNLNDQNVTFVNGLAVESKVVTEGDKVEAQIQLGWTVDYWPVGDLVDEVDAVSEADIDAEYKKLSEM